jgi:ankyrin repeat protein
MPQALPANPNLDWLKKTAKQRLVRLRIGQPDAKLYEAQLALAHDYGFKSWRALKSHVDSIAPAFGDRDRVFEAARAGDIEAVRRAFASGFDPATPDSDGRTVHQIAKQLGHEAIEMLARDLQGGKTRPDDEMQAIQAVMRAAQSGDLDALRAGLDQQPDRLHIAM